MKNNFPIHGANPENLYRFFNIAIPGKILDFSTNTNIFEIPNFNLDIKNLVSSYPDPECKKLYEFISEREKISASKILFTNGINEAIFLLANFFKNKSTGIFQPCYSEYSRAFPDAENVFEINRAGDFEVFIIVNPNNPTGFFIKNLADLIKIFPKTIFIIDEAYIDFLLNDSPEKLSNFENVILLRSLTKFFHLSGARIGYVIANEKIIEALKNFQPTWSVNAVAQELALRFLSDKNFYDASRDFYKTAVPEFMNALKNSGFKISDSSVNFFLIKIKNDFEIIKFLLKSGIVVRHTRNFLGLAVGDEKYIRVATKKPDENDFFIEKLIRARNLYPDYF
ncbi:MAG: aminotransferase class I/II-fold pyridoxal phosphate-dependent enzyme [Synergistaceae bacterium]|nr:aminotransferase class I/II-fold pyridoxal phosphate-dependent enzyme [Synergistaceae bacterium]